MKRYKLVEKGNPPIGGTANVKNRFFFRADDETCYKLFLHIDFMRENNIESIDLVLAEREVRVDRMFCKEYGVGDRAYCGQWCPLYTPKNGKGGACKHFGYTYERTDRVFTLFKPLS